ncbi:hypothetical protein [Poseidonibacter antarcticus]|uniref:hypothetical protein n=1 Tax=Poseidonibacter antarcticus TaxID=2478538 RepID=UPI000EF4E0AD|nr:hypothetical protein [Poseidonibacter antarcticus]
MKKVLLIEDRPKRQKDFLESANIDLETYSDVLDNKIDSDFTNFMLKIKKDDFDLNIYEVVIAHQSIFINEDRVILGKLQSYCKKNKKSLVLFSGGNETSYSREDYELLHLSSEDFYSKNLILFLEDLRQDSINIRILSFGKQWKLNIILNILENVNIFIDNNADEDIDYDDFANKTKINLILGLDKKFYEMKIENNWVYLTEILKLRDSIINVVKELADE